MNPTAKSIANLKPIKPGEVRNPWGRSGKDGNQGFSLKYTFKRFLQDLTPDKIELIWKALYAKSLEGDTKSIELMVKLNDEVLEAHNNLAANEQIIINIPAKDGSVNDSAAAEDEDTAAEDDEDTAVDAVDEDK